MMFQTRRTSSIRFAPHSAESSLTPTLPGEDLWCILKQVTRKSRVDGFSVHRQESPAYLLSLRVSYVRSNRGDEGKPQHLEEIHAGRRTKMFEADGHTSVA